MKKFTWLKLISVIFVCAMIIGAAALAVVAAEEQETVEIFRKNIIFDDKIKLVFAIKGPDDAVVEATCNGETFGRKTLYTIMVKFITPALLLLLLLQAMGVVKL